MTADSFKDFTWMKLWPIVIAVLMVSASWGATRMQMSDLQKTIDKLSPLRERVSRLEVLFDAHLTSIEAFNGNARITLMETNIAVINSQYAEILRQLEAHVRTQGNAN